MADLLGLGTSPLAAGYIYFGFWQARGVLIGEAIIFIGFLMMIPYNRDFPPLPGDSDAGDEEKENISISLEN